MTVVTIVCRLCLKCQFIYNKMTKFGPKNIMEACSEYLNSSHEGWELLNDIGTSTLFCKWCPNTELYEYKCIFTVENAQPKEFLEFSSDMDYWPKWNTYVKSIRRMEGGKYYYWETRMPFPLNNRDYVFSLTNEIVEYEKQIIQVLDLRGLKGCIPEMEGIVRVNDFRQIICAAIDEKCPTTSLIMCYYYIDLKTVIPKWLTNLLAKVVFPKQHQSLLEEFRKYQQNQNEEKDMNGTEERSSSM